jgi:hypothetical protein
MVITSLPAVIAAGVALYGSTYGSTPIWAPGEEFGHTYNGYSSFLCLSSLLEMG